MATNHAPWVVVLAGGAGTRLSALTVDRDGQPVPKQFCSLRGGTTLLADTLERAMTLTSADRVLVVVAAEHGRWWRPQLAHLDPANVFVQPQRRGTAPGILLPLRAAIERDPQARVVIMPSDHYFAAPAVALSTLRLALLNCDDATRPVILLGITPDGPDTEYGWIVPTTAVRASAPMPIVRFVEKPGIGIADALWRAGAMWNSFLVVAHAQALWNLAEQHVPSVTAGLDSWFIDGARPAALPAVYRAMPETDFSRAVLQSATKDLRLLPVPACGWTDLGSPHRVAECLANMAAADPLASDASAATIVLAEALHHFATPH